MKKLTEITLSSVALRDNIRLLSNTLGQDEVVKVLRKGHPVLAVMSWETYQHVLAILNLGLHTRVESTVQTNMLLDILDGRGTHDSERLHE